MFSEDIIHISKFKLLNLFPQNLSWYRHHILCPECSSCIGKRADLSKNKNVKCAQCESDVEVRKAPYFVTLNVKSQLEMLLENPLVQPHLQYKSNRQKLCPDNLEDILDGELYKKLSQPGEILYDKWNFAYTL